METHEVEKALSYIDATDRDIWLKVGSALKTELGDNGFTTFNDWSKKATNYDEKAVKAAWRSFKPNLVTMGTLVFLAKQNGYIPSKISKKSQIDLKAQKQGIQEQKTFDKVNLQELKEKAKNRALFVWNKSIYANPNHPYLINKNISAKSITNIRSNTYQGRNSLVIPIYNNHNEITSLQFISETGQKTFLKDGEIKGNSMTIGSIENAKEIILAEGFATGATIYEATDKPVVVCFNAGNLAEVAKKLAQKNQNINYYIAADNDLSATGVEKAMEALKSLPNAKIVIPHFTKNQVQEFMQKNNNTLPSDFNDLAQLTSNTYIAQFFPKDIQVNHEAAKPTDYHVKQVDSTNINKQQNINQINSTKNIEEMNMQKNNTKIQDIEPEDFANGIEGIEEIENEYIEEVTPQTKNQKILEQYTNSKKQVHQNQQEVDNTNASSSNTNNSNNYTEEIKKEPKAIFDLNYELPPSVKKYIFDQGKFLDQNLNLQFTDFGKEIKTQKFDAFTINHMLDVAQAKNWNEIKVTGTRQFKLNAWVLATERGMTVSGFKPTEQELKLLDKINLANSIENPHNTNQNQEREIKDINNNEALYKVVDFGEAPYNFIESNKKSFFLTIEKDGIKETKWGNELAEAIHHANVGKGDYIKSVDVIKTIPKKYFVNNYDDKGRIIGQKEKTFTQNIWQIKKPEVEPQVKTNPINNINNNPQNQNKTKPSFTNETYKIINMGDDIDKNGNKSFFVKIEKAGKQQIIWGQSLKDEVKNQELQKGDFLINIELKDGKWNLTPVTTKKQETEPPKEIKENNYKIVNFGDAPMNFEPTNEQNFFLRVEDANGVAKTYWGKGLKSAIKSAGVKKGDEIKDVSLQDKKWQILPLKDNEKKIERPKELKIVSDNQLKQVKNDYEKAKENLPKTDQLKLQFLENEARRVYSKFNVQEQNALMHSFYNNIQENYIKGNKLEIPSGQQQSVNQSQEVQQEIEEIERS